MHPNAPDIADFVLVNNLLESMVRKEILDRTELNQLLEQCATLNETTPLAATTTNADAAKLIRQLIK